MALRIAVLASGSGSNLASILRGIEDGKLDGQVVLVLSNKPAAYALERAKAAGIATWARAHKEFASREEFDLALVRAIQDAGADTVVLAGYMRILTPAFVRAFPGRILNIHPAILPSFPGAHGGKDALDYGVRLTGATVHFVDEIMDNGPVIMQAAVPVRCDDTLETLMPRIQAMEHRIYPQALQWLAEDRLRVEGRQVRLLPPASGTPAASASCGENEHGPWMVSPALEKF